MPERIYSPPSVDVVTRSRPIRAKAVLTVVAAAFAAAALAVAYLGQYAAILELNYEIAREKRELDKIHQERVNLKTDLYRRRSLAEVDGFARRELGMHAPRAGQIVIVEETP